MLCKSFNSLPGPGGIMEQDSYLMYGLLHFQHYVNEHQRRENEKRSRK